MHEYIHSQIDKVRRKDLQIDIDLYIFINIDTRIENRIKGKISCTINDTFSVKPSKQTIDRQIYI